MIKRLAAIAGIALAVPAQAQEATVEPDHLMTVLKDAGYPAEYFNEDLDYRQILSKSGDYNFLVEMYDCTDGKACEILELYSNFPMESAPSEEMLDAYPGPLDGARLSLDRRGEARIQQEIVIDGGLSDERFIERVKAWETVLAGVVAYLTDPSGASATAGTTATEAAAAPAAATADAS
jgi:hypothetical protein